MERAIVHSDLTKNKIQPEFLLEKYIELLNLDIQKFFTEELLEKVFCPVSGEKEISRSFIKMDMQYNFSKTHGNIYLSPRPSINTLKQFYKDSEARKFWLKDLWPKTQAARKDKIILPQLQWANGFISQYFQKKEILLAEYYPNHWGYSNSAQEVFQEAKYFLVEPLFDPEISGIPLNDLCLVENVPQASLDAVFLFEALDRSTDPNELLTKASNSLKSGGLCFITSLLSSGFEVQLLGEKSEIFVPPERMNILSFEGMNELIKNLGHFEVLEFSTPGVFDIPNVVESLNGLDNSSFFEYIFKKRQDIEIKNSFQDYLQMNRLGTFARLVLRKK